MTNEDIVIITTAIDIAYEAGKWHGQVELEEHIEKEQFSQALLEAVISRKTSSPSDCASTGRTVRYNLRSEKWRIGVKKHCEEYKRKALSMLMPLNPQLKLNL